MVCTILIFKACHVAKTNGINGKNRLKSLINNYHNIPSLKNVGIEYKIESQFIWTIVRRRLFRNVDGSNLAV